MRDVDSRLLDIIRANTKRAFVPIPSGQMPPDPNAVDPATGAPIDPNTGAPMDPAAAGAPPPGDPSMMPAGAGAQPAMPVAGAPSAPPAASPGGTSMAYDQVIQAVRQVMQEMGGVPGGGGAAQGKKGGGKAQLEERVALLEAGQAILFEKLGVVNPQQVLGEAMAEMQAQGMDPTQQQGGGFGPPGSGSGGGGAPAQGAPPPPTGPMDPNAGAAMAAAGQAAQQRINKMSALTSNGRRLSETLSRLRR